jgi:hypothetical protein
MPNITHSFFISDEGLALINILRDKISIEEFFRRLIELGLTDVIEQSAQLNRDYLNHMNAGDTKDFRIGRAALFRIAAPEQDKPKH